MVRSQTNHSTLVEEDLPLISFNRSHVRHGTVRVIARMAASRRGARYPNCCQRPGRRVRSNCRAADEQKSNQSSRMWLRVREDRVEGVRQRTNTTLGPSPTVTRIRAIQSLAQLLLKFSASSRRRILFPTSVKQANCFASACTNTLMTIRMWATYEAKACFWE